MHSTTMKKSKNIQYVNNFDDIMIINMNKALEHNGIKVYLFQIVGDLISNKFNYSAQLLSIFFT